jgi:hypothetical protein
MPTQPTEPHPRFMIIDPPTPFSPLEEMYRFIADNEKNPHPQMREEVERVRGFLAEAVKWRAN